MPHRSHQRREAHHILGVADSGKLSWKKSLFFSDAESFFTAHRALAVALEAEELKLIDRRWKR
jgi:hypothetical protein